MPARTMGRPKAIWSTREKSYLLHAQQAAVADRLTERTLKDVKGYKNPVVRLTASHAVLGLESECLAVRREAMWELRNEGWSWRKIGSLMNVNHRRAFQIAHGL